MRRLLEVPPSDIKIQKRVQPGIFGSLGRVQLMVALIRSVKFVMGEDFAEMIKAAVHRISPAAQDESDFSSLASLDSKVIDPEVDAITNSSSQL